MIFPHHYLCHIPILISISVGLYAEYCTVSNANIETLLPLGFTSLAGNRVYSCRGTDLILHTGIEQKVKDGEILILGFQNEKFAVSGLNNSTPVGKSMGYSG